MTDPQSTEAIHEELMFVLPLFEVRAGMDAKTVNFDTEFTAIELLEALTAKNLGPPLKHRRLICDVICDAYRLDSYDQHNKLQVRMLTQTMLEAMNSSVPKLAAQFERLGDNDCAHYLDNCIELLVRAEKLRNPERWVMDSRKTGPAIPLPFYAQPSEFFSDAQMARLGLSALCGLATYSHLIQTRGIGVNPLIAALFFVPMVATLQKLLQLRHAYQPLPLGGEAQQRHYRWRTVPQQANALLLISLAATASAFPLLHKHTVHGFDRITTALGACKAAEARHPDESFTEDWKKWLDAADRFLQQPRAAVTKEDRRSAQETASALSYYQSAYRHEAKVNFAQPLQLDYLGEAERFSGQSTLDYHEYESLKRFLLEAATKAKDFINEIGEPLPADKQVRLRNAAKALELRPDAQLLIRSRKIYRAIGNALEQTRLQPMP